MRDVLRRLKDGMTPARPWGAALVLVLAAAAAEAAEPARWSVEGGKARSGKIESNDGTRAVIEVRCAERPEVRLRHERLSELPVERRDRRPGWYGVVRTRAGWGLDLRRPDHPGAQAYWFRCEGEPDCLVAREPEWIVRQLKSQWTWSMMIEPPARPATHLLISLAGSHRAIEKVCGNRGTPPRESGKSNPRGS